MNYFVNWRRFVAERFGKSGANSQIGDFQLVVLGVVNQLGEDAYGMRVRDEVQTILNRAVHMPQVYSALGRLESAGLLTSEPNSTKSAGHRGRTRRYYKIGANGLQILHDAFRHSFRNMPMEGNNYAEITAATTA